MGRAVRQGGSFHSLRNTGHTGRRQLKERMKHCEIVEWTHPQKAARGGIKPVIFNATQMEGWSQAVLACGD